MPKSRDAAAYFLYIEARKVWRSKIEWQLTHEEATRILTDVTKAADLGDWGARALLARFYLEGLGPLKSNNVLNPDPYKAVEIARMAAEAALPWGIYDLGVAYEHGYGGAHYDVDLAWAHYLRAAELGSPEAQMALAGAYAQEGRPNDEETMMKCAYQQGHGPAAYQLSLTARVKKNHLSAMDICQQGTKFGSKECAASLELFFAGGNWAGSSEEEKETIKLLGMGVDLERSSRYSAIYSALEINPDLKLSRLDEFLPLPPAKLPAWSGVIDTVEPESTSPPKY